MEIIKNQNGGKLEVKLVGRLDTITAPELEASLGGIEGVSELIMDFASLEYVSSAGLRILLKYQKIINSTQGSMELLNVNPSVKEVFDVTGFSDILTIK